jgi:hypothetical protein
MGPILNSLQAIGIWNIARPEESVIGGGGQEKDKMITTYSLRSLK